MRIQIAHTDTYHEAAELKVGLIEKFPERKFQVRRKRNGFDIVERKQNAQPEKSNPSRNKKRWKKNQKGSIQ